MYKRVFIDDDVAMFECYVARNSDNMTANILFSKEVYQYEEMA